MIFLKGIRTSLQLWFNENVLLELVPHFHTIMMSYGPKFLEKTLVRHCVTLNRIEDSQLCFEIFLMLVLRTLVLPLRAARPPLRTQWSPRSPPRW